MHTQEPLCLKKYDFSHVSRIAIRRYLDGQDTINMLLNAKTAQDVEEICLVSLLNVEGSIVKTIKLSCFYSANCQETQCCERLRDIIELELNCKKNNLDITKIL